MNARRTGAARTKGPAANGSVASYIVRVYRRSRSRPRRLVGVVEEVGVEGTRAFGGPDDLWRILEATGMPASKGAGKPRRGRR